MRTISIISIGRMAYELGVDQQRVEALAKLLGIAPLQKINRIAHYEESDFERIRQELHASSPGPHG
jgi:hypothetical protein